MDEICNNCFKRKDQMSDTTRLEVYNMQMQIKLAYMHEIQLLKKMMTENVAVCVGDSDLKALVQTRAVATSSLDMKLMAQKNENNSGRIS